MANGKEWDILEAELAKFCERLSEVFGQKFYGSIDGVEQRLDDMIRGEFVTTIHIRVMKFDRKQPED